MKNNVLIVEDSKLTSQAISFMLTAHRFSVAGVAGDGEAAVKMYKKLKPDLVLMDIAMPKKHGIDAIGEIRAMDPKARIIAVTALYSPEKRNAALEAGAAAVVSKPIDIPELIRTIESLLQKI